MGADSSAAKHSAAAAALRTDGLDQLRHIILGAIDPGADRIGLHALRRKMVAAAAPWRSFGGPPQPIDPFAVICRRAFQITDLRRNRVRCFSGALAICLVPRSRQL